MQCRGGSRPCLPSWRRARARRSGGHASSPCSPLVCEPLAARGRPGSAAPCQPRSRGYNKLWDPAASPPAPLIAQRPITTKAIVAAARSILWFCRQPGAIAVLVEGPATMHQSLPLRQLAAGGRAEGAAVRVGLRHRAYLDSTFRAILLFFCRSLARTPHARQWRAMLVPRQPAAISPPLGDVERVESCSVSASPQVRLHRMGARCRGPLPLTAVVPPAILSLGLFKVERVPTQLIACARVSQHTGHVLAIDRQHEATVGARL